MKNLIKKCVCANTSNEEIFEFTSLQSHDLGDCSIPYCWYSKSRYSQQQTQSTSYINLSATKSHAPLKMHKSWNTIPKQVTPLRWQTMLKTWLRKSYFDKCVRQASMRIKVIRSNQHPILKLLIRICISRRFQESYWRSHSNYELFKTSAQFAWTARESSPGFGFPIQLNLPFRNVFMPKRTACCILIPFDLCSRWILSHIIKRWKDPVK